MEVMRQRRKGGGRREGRRKGKTKGGQRGTQREEFYRRGFWRILEIFDSYSKRQQPWRPQLTGVDQGCFPPLLTSRVRKITQKNF